MTVGAFPKFERYRFDPSSLAPNPSHTLILLRSQPDMRLSPQRALPGPHAWRRAGARVPPSPLDFARLFPSAWQYRIPRRVSALMGQRAQPRSARSRDGHPAAAPELSAAEAQKGVVADRTREVTRSPMAARKRTVAARPCVVAVHSRVEVRSWVAARSRVAVRSRAAAGSRAAARKRTVVARPRVVVDGSREAGRSRQAAHERRVVAHSRVVVPRSRVRVTTCKHMAGEHSRMMADRTAELGHNRAAAEAAAVHNHAAIQKHTVVPQSDQGRRAAHNRAPAGSHLGLPHDQETRPRPGALPAWPSQCKGSARNPLFGVPGQAQH
jgi:hypothetical protein